MTYLETLYAAREAAGSTEAAMHVQWLIDEHKRATGETADFSTPPDRRAMTKDAQPAHSGEGA